MLCYYLLCRYLSNNKSIQELLHNMLMRCKNECIIPWSLNQVIQMKRKGGKFKVFINTSFASDELVLVVILRTIK